MSLLEHLVFENEILPFIEENKNAKLKAVIKTAKKIELVELKNKHF